jgi:hypothetical protein
MERKIQEVILLNWQRRNRENIIISVKEINPEPDSLVTRALLSFCENKFKKKKLLLIKNATILVYVFAIYVWSKLVSKAKATSEP